MGARCIRHIGEELRFLRAMLGTVRHVGAEIVNLPLLRDRQVQRIVAAWMAKLFLSCILLSRQRLRGVIIGDGVPNK